MTSDARPARTIARKAAEVARPRPVPPPLRPWVRPVARVGLVAKAAVYLTLGALAARGAIGWVDRGTDTRGAIEALGHAGGAPLAALIALGLLCYAGWRFVQAIADTDRKGSDWEGLGARATHLGSGLAHTALALTALGVAAGAHADRSGVARWTRTAFAAPVGEVVVGLVGAAVMVVGLFQFAKAVTQSFAEHLDTARMGRRARAWVLRLGRLGHAARGVTFEIVGWFLLRAALHADPDEARGVDGAFRFLRAQEHGGVFLGVVAAGVVAYGAYTLLLARYRRLDAGPARS